MRNKQNDLYFNMFIDIHTHNETDDDNVLAIINLKCHEPFPTKEGLYSVGIHPWDVSEHSQTELFSLCPHLPNKQIVAIGEIGLDKISDSDWTLQNAVFETQIKMANAVQKPIIIHCVKAYNELLGFKGLMETPAIIHGFRGKPQLMKSLCNAGFYFSYGQKFNEETLKETPADRLFLETDDAETTIQTVYQQVAEAKRCEVSFLEQMIETNFRKIIQQR